MSIIGRLGTVLVCLLAMAAAPAARALPSFSKTFMPDTIGPGSATLLRFQISNDGGIPATDLDFTDFLPAGVTLASPAHPTTTCTSGLIAAPDGGSAINFNGGAVAANSSCVVDVYVTSSTPGTHMNVSGDLTSSAGNSGTATADLTVATSRPGFSKSFSPSTVQLGQRSTLTFTVDNSLNASQATNLAFTDTLPAGLQVADPASVTNGCIVAPFTGGAVTATPGSGTVSLGFSGIASSAVAANATCSITVDVVATGSGQQDNISGVLTGNVGAGTVQFGVAVAKAQINVDTVQLVKEFTDDPVAPGSTGTLRFTLSNLDRSADATTISFSDDLGATLAGLVATGLPMPACGGTLSQAGGVITLTGASVAAGISCDFDVALLIPAGATPGAYPNTTSTLSANQFGSSQIYSAASDTLFVSDAPTLTKEFTDDPVAAGGAVTLEFTIDNNSSTSAATNISFIDELTTFLPFPVSATMPAPGFCGAGSSASVISLGTEVQGLFVTGANLAASDSCTFSVSLNIPIDMPAGTFLNQTRPITATVNGENVTGGIASDSLLVVAAPRLLKEFIDDPIAPGSTGTLRFTLDNAGEGAEDASLISFSDDLDAALTGLVAVGLPMNDVCGTGSSISGTGNLTFSGGSVPAGETCSFDVTVAVPAAAIGNSYTNTTSAISASVLGLPVSGPAASADLLVAGLTFSKQFTDDPVLPGDTVTLAFTIDNTAAATDATGISFIDSLNSMLSGAVAVAPLPATPCGAGSSITGTSTLIFSGGNLTAGASCTFSVTVQVPAAAANGDYSNVTSGMTATVGGSPVVLPSAQDVLSVNNNLLLLQKSFTDDPVMPGDTVTLAFTLSNQDAVNPATSVAFTDDLGASLTGLVAVGLPVAGCGGTAAANPDAGTIDFSGGSLAAGGNCTFGVTLQVPAGASPGDYVNTTSTATGSLGGLPVTGDPASDTLAIRVVDFSKSFDGPAAATQTAVLSFTIDNIDASNPAINLAFSDDLDAVLPGLVATGLPLSDVCGAGSQISGSSFLTMTGGAVGPGESCSFDVTVQVPATATAGSYPNTTSALTASGLDVAVPALADLVIEPPPTFAKAFSPATVGVGQASTLGFTVDNSASALVANALDFSDNLPAGMAVAVAPNLSTTCVGGTISANPGSAVISYSGGAVAAGSVCTLSVDVVASPGGAFVNTSGDLTSTSGNSGSASDTLTVVPQPAFSKLFAPDAIAANGVSTLTFTIDNTASSVALSGLAFSDNLPAGMTVATPPNASTTCTGGTITAVAGSGTIQYSGASVAAGATCTLSADVTAATPGSYANSSGALMSSIGTAGMANDTLTVVAAPLFAKVFAPNPVAIGQSSTLSFSIDNSASVLAATALDFTDNLPAGLLVAATPNASTTCTGGTITAVGGSGTITYTGGSVAAGATCTVSVDTSVAAAGDYVNTSGDLTSSSGNSGPAGDTLTVVEGPLFAKAFAPATVEIGGISTLTFSIDNAISPLAVTALDFTDNLPAGMVVANPANASTSCTGGTVTAAVGAGTVGYTGGSVGAGANCTISVDVQAQAAGTLSNTTSVMTSSGGSSGTASADLTVTAGAIAISKAFQGDPVLRGGQVVLRYTINNQSASADVDNVAFSDDIGAVISGWTAVGLPAADVCGTGSSVGGTSVVSLSGGTIPAGDSCTFDVTLQLPANAPLGIVSSTSGSVSGDTFGSPVSGNTATDTLQIVWLGFSKAFVFSGAPIPGNDIGLMFTISNPDPVNAVGGITFTDDLGAAVPGMTANGLPMNDVCGAGSQASGSSVVTLSNGSIVAGGSCSFQISVHIPNSITAGTYTNNTSPLTATPAGGAASSGDPADIASASIALPNGVPAPIQAPELIPTLDPRWLLALAAMFLMIVAVRLRPNG